MTSFKTRGDKKPTVFEITRRSKHVLGFYMENPIHEYIFLEDGRSFVFESIAIKMPGGSYHTDFQGEIYVLVNGNLLYREVKS